MIAKKVKHGWGYAVGPFPPDVVLVSHGGVLSIAHWPDNNPPTIAEIEAVELPEPTPAPDWATFRQAILASTALDRIATDARPHHFATLNQLAWIVDSDPTKMIEFAGVWNLIASYTDPTETEIAELNAIGTAANVPFALNESGMMV